MAKATKTKKKKVFRVEALEKFTLRTTYFVEANSAAEAEKLCKEGKVAYDDSEVEGDEEWLGVEQIEVVEEYV